MFLFSLFIHSVSFLSFVIFYSHFTDTLSNYESSCFLSSTPIFHPLYPHSTVIPPSSAANCLCSSTNEAEKSRFHVSIFEICFCLCLWLCLLIMVIFLPWSHIILSAMSYIFSLSYHVN